MEGVRRMQMLSAPNFEKLFVFSASVINRNKLGGWQKHPIRRCSYCNSGYHVSDTRMEDFFRQSQT